MSHAMNQHYLLLFFVLIPGVFIIISETMNGVL